MINEYSELEDILMEENPEPDQTETETAFFQDQYGLGIGEHYFVDEAALEIENAIKEVRGEPEKNLEVPEERSEEPPVRGTLLIF